MRAGDPRRSIEERYTSREAYMDLVSDAASALVATEYLLAEDVSPIVAQAGRHWDYLMNDK